MAAAPVKSPLHNFPLTFLKWGSKKDTRCRRTPPYDAPLSPPQQPTPPPDDTNTTTTVENSKPVGSRSSRNRRNNNHLPSSTETPPPPPDDDGEEKDGGGDCERGWNLRPRRAVTWKGGCSNNNINTSSAMVVETNGGAGGDGVLKSMRLRGLETVGSGGGCAGAGGGERREKRKFWIALSRDEIEEDIYSMTGSKPSRRPKKRPKNVQKQLDNVFPGLWLVGISPEAYRGLDVPPKVNRI